MISALQCSCISGWMTAGTGMYPNKLRGKSRTQVIGKLGQPQETKTTWKNEFASQSLCGVMLKSIDRFAYTGKVNSIDEGSGQAIANALTLGTSEMIAIPLTTVEIIARSFGHHQIYVMYDKDEVVIDAFVDPRIGW